MQEYHSAHLPWSEDPPVEYVAFDNGTAQVHDLLAGPPLPYEYGDADVLYAEPAWQRGFETFNQRAKVEDGRTYKVYARNVAALVDTGKPTVIIWGRHAERFLPEYESAIPVWLDRHSAVAYLFNNVQVPETVRTTLDVMHALADRYEVLGDPCCGWGNTARIATEHGKRFVVSDFNPYCIGHIATKHGEWPTSMTGDGQ